MCGPVIFDRTPSVEYIIPIVNYICRLEYVGGRTEQMSSKGGECETDNRRIRGRPSIRGRGMRIGDKDTDKERRKRGRSWKAPTGSYC